MNEQQKRAAMVENQLRPSNVHDPRVLSAMGLVSREAFLPPALRSVAYNDEDLVLPDRGFLIEPLVLARMLQALSLGPNDTLLVLGCVTGYAAVVASRLAGTVFLAVDGNADQDALNSLFSAQEADNVFTVEPPRPLEGFPENAPYDAILVIGALDRLPQALLQQLPAGGHLAVVIRQRHGGRIKLVSRFEHGFAERDLFDASTPAFVAAPETPAFQF
ncbi:MAG: protein-L-isoaspartate O-methyltransferase [Geminicoccaceae bacterium]